jgi:hypothetical protein
MLDTVKPFFLSTPEETLTDLRVRLARTRLPSAETVHDISQGPTLAAMQKLKDYWLGQYDWRRCEALLNELGQFTTEIDGLRPHHLTEFTEA